MGSFGSSKKSSASGQQASLGNFYSPFGNVVTDKRGNVQFTPILTGQQQANLDATATGIGNAIGSLPKQFSVSDMYNNPFYGTASALLRMPVDRQYEQDSVNLDNNLNAKNQLGSSFDALQRNYLNQDRDYNLNQAELQARQTSADAYNQNIGNALSTLSGLQNSQSQQYDTIYRPLQAAPSFQANANNARATQANANYRQDSLGYGLGGQLGSSLISALARIWS